MAAMNVLELSASFVSMATVVVGGGVVVVVGAGVTMGVGGGGGRLSGNQTWKVFCFSHNWVSIYIISSRSIVCDIFSVTEPFKTTLPVSKGYFLF